MNVDVCVIGAGPAGLSAATGLARFGRNVVVIDEMPEAGGRLLGQLHQVGNRNDRFHRDGWWEGRRIAGDLRSRAEKAGVQFLLGESVWGIYSGWRICLTGEEPCIVEAENIVIATGASERAVPIPGWDLPSVMSIGAAQVMTTQHRVRPGNRVLVAGIDPLSLAISHELQMGGIEVVAIVNLPPQLTYGDHTPAAAIANLARVSHLAPSRALRVAGQLGRWTPIASLAAYIQPHTGMRAWDIPIEPRLACTSILGQDQVDGVILSRLTADGSVIDESETQVEVDAVCISGGLRPLSELCDLVDCQTAQIPEVGGRVPLFGPDYQTTTPGVYLAGNVTGIESAMVAMAQGHTVAAAIAAPERLDEFRKREEAARRTSPLTFMPELESGRSILENVWKAHRTGAEFAMQVSANRHLHTQNGRVEDLPDDLVICRCEEVTLGDLRRATESGLDTAEELKRFTRVGMGSCQGRVCNEVLGLIEHGLVGDSSPASFPKHRPPVRPVRLGDLASLAVGNEEHERLHGTLLPSLPFDDPTSKGIADPDR